jgi:hypothetical protein
MEWRWVWILDFEFGALVRFEGDFVRGIQFDRFYEDRIGHEAVVIWSLEGLI